MRYSLIDRQVSYEESDTEDSSAKVKTLPPEVMAYWRWNQRFPLQLYRYNYYHRHRLCWSLLTRCAPSTNRKWRSLQCKVKEKHWLSAFDSLSFKIKNLESCLQFPKGFLYICVKLFICNMLLFTPLYIYMSCLTDNFIYLLFCMKCKLNSTSGRAKIPEKPVCRPQVWHKSRK